MKKDRPIGVFDSGLGGLTVAKAISKALPNESLVYFGDTAHLPYGDKSSASIRHYASRIAHFLIEQKCKMIVIACNTASAFAWQTVLDACGPKIPVINVIDPVVEYTTDRFKDGKIGVIGTKGTVQSRIYTQRLQRENPRLRVVSQATPLLVPIIEEGFFNDSISESVIHQYLDRKTFKNLDALILGCTHYPLIKRQVKAYYEGKTEIIDSGSAVAKEVQKTLSAAKLLSTKGEPSFRFYVSDYTDVFAKSTRIFFKKKLELEEFRMWD